MKMGKIEGLNITGVDGDGLSSISLIFLENYGTYNHEELYEFKFPTKELILEFLKEIKPTLEKYEKKAREYKKEATRLKKEIKGVFKK